MGHAVLRAALAAVLLVHAPAAARSSRVLLPDLRPLAEALHDHYFYTEGGRTLLCFTTTIANAGEGPIEVRGVRRNGRMRAYQVLRYRNRALRLVPIGRFDYHRQHGHWHLMQVAEYRLRNVEGMVVARSEKVSFCLVDTELVYPWLKGSPESPVYRRCPRNEDAERLRVGISVGWCDIYGSDLAGQSLDVTGLPPGDYTLECEVNPEGLLRERSRRNNTACAVIAIPASESAPTRASR